MPDLRWGLQEQEGDLRWGMKARIFDSKHDKDDYGSYGTMDVSIKCEVASFKMEIAPWNPRILVSTWKTGSCSWQMSETIPCMELDRLVDGDPVTSRLHIPYSNSQETMQYRHS